MTVPSIVSGVAHGADAGNTTTTTVALPSSSFSDGNTVWIAIESDASSQVFTAPPRFSTFVTNQPVSGGTATYALFYQKNIVKANETLVGANYTFAVGLATTERQAWVVWATTGDGDFEQQGANHTGSSPQANSVGFTTVTPNVLVMVVVATDGTTTPHTDNNGGVQYTKLDEASGTSAGSISVWYYLVATPHLIDTLFVDLAASEQWGTIALSLLPFSGIGPSEAVTLSETPTVDLLNTVNVPSSLTITETVLTVIVTEVNVASTVTVTEVASLVVSTPIISVLETTTTSEAVTLVTIAFGTFNMNATETATASETVSLTTATLALSVTDTATVAEGRTLEVVSLVSVSNTATASETATAETDRLVIGADTATASETVTLAPLMTPSVSNTATHTESVALTVLAVNVHATKVGDTATHSETTEILLSAISHVPDVVDAVSGTVATGDIVTLDSWSPDPDDLILVFVGFQDLGATVPTVSGNGITFDLIERRYNDNGSSAGLIFYRGMSAAPTTGAITLDFNLSNTGPVAAVAVRIKNCSTAGINGSGAIEAYTTASSPAVSATRDMMGVVTTQNQDSLVVMGGTHRNATLTVPVGQTADAINVSAGAGGVQTKTSVIHKPGGPAGSAITLGGPNDLSSAKQWVTATLSLREAGTHIDDEDTATITEVSVLAVSTANLSAGDTATTDEPVSVSVLPNANTSDTATHSETVTLTVLAVGFSATKVFEYVTPLETTTLALALPGISKSDTATLTEAVNFDLFRSLAVADSATLSETAHGEVVKNVAVSNTVTLTEAKAVVTLPNPKANETITVSEAWASEVFYTVMVTNTVTVTEAKTADKLLNIHVVETVGTGDFFVYFMTIAVLCNREIVRGWRYATNPPSEIF